MSLIIIATSMVSVLIIVLTRVLVILVIVMAFLST